MWCPCRSSPSSPPTLTTHTLPCRMPTSVHDLFGTMIAIDGSSIDGSTKDCSSAPCRSLRAAASPSPPARSRDSSIDGFTIDGSAVRWRFRLGLSPVQPLIGDWRSSRPDFRVRFRFESPIIDKICTRMVYVDRFPKSPVAKGCIVHAYVEGGLSGTRFKTKCDRWLHSPSTRKNVLHQNHVQTSLSRGKKSVQMYAISSLGLMPKMAYPPLSQPLKASDSKKYSVVL